MNNSITFDQIKKWCLGVDTLEDAEAGIRRDGMLQKGLATWSKRLRNVAIALAAVVVIFRSGPMIIPALGAAAAYGLVKLASYLVDKDITNKQAAAHELAAKEMNRHAPSPKAEPAPKPGVKATGAFNATTVAKEAANDAAKPPASKVGGLLKRFGLGN